MSTQTEHWRQDFAKFAVLPQLQGQYFDLIYVDGSHDAPFVLLDAMLSWEMLKPGASTNSYGRIIRSSSRRRTNCSLPAIPAGDVSVIR